MGRFTARLFKWSPLLFIAMGVTGCVLLIAPSPNNSTSSDLPLASVSLPEDFDQNFGSLLAGISEEDLAPLLEQTERAFGPREARSSTDPKRVSALASDSLIETMTPGQRTFIDELPDPTEVSEWFDEEMQVTFMQLVDPNQNQLVDGRWYEPRIIVEGCSKRIDAPETPSVNIGYGPGDADLRVNSTPSFDSLSSKVSVSIDVYDNQQQRDQALAGNLEYETTIIPSCPEFFKPSTVDEPGWFPGHSRVFVKQLIQSTVHYLPIRTKGWLTVAFLDADRSEDQQRKVVTKLVERLNKSDRFK
jgi:hypothetical protein